MPEVPAWSVVVPTFDRDHTIDTTLGTVRAAADRLLELEGQTIEIIVVDDGSTDGTVERLEQLADFDPRLRFIAQANAGPSAARNAGAQIAAAPYLAFLDADDAVGGDWLLGFARAVGTGAPDLVFGSARLVGPGARATSSRRRWDPERLGPAFGDVIGRFNPGVFAIRRDRFLACGGYSTALRFSENTELGLRLARDAHDRGRPLTSVTTRPRSVTSGPATGVTLDAALDAVITMPAGAGHSNAYSDQVRLESALHIVDAHHDHLARTDRSLLATYWAIAGVAAARLGRADDARDCFWRATTSDPRPRPATVRNLVRLSVAAVPPLRQRQWPASPTLLQPSTDRG